MPYCTQTHLTARFGAEELIRLTNPDDVSAVVVDDAVLDQAIADAGAEIDAYIAAWLPLSPVPANFVRMACDIVRFYLYKDSPTDAVQKAYDRALRYLEKVGKGDLGLGPDSNGDIDQRPSETVSMQSAESVFSRDAY